MFLAKHQGVHMTCQWPIVMCINYRSNFAEQPYWWNICASNIGDTLVQKLPVWDFSCSLCHHLRGSMCINIYSRKTLISFHFSIQLFFTGNQSTVGSVKLCFKRTASPFNFFLSSSSLLSSSTITVLSDGVPFYTRRFRRKRGRVYSNCWNKLIF